MDEAIESTVMIARFGITHFVSCIYIHMEIRSYRATLRQLSWMMGDESVDPASGNSMEMSGAKRRTYLLLHIHMLEYLELSETIL